MRRREVIKLGIVAVGCVGCGGGDEVPVDAMPPGGFTMCGAEICVDLADPSNAALADINGARALSIPDKIVVIRLTATTFAVLSRVCTHQGCQISYQPSSMILACGCHGSQFDTSGGVLRGPATRSLKRYTSTFDELTQTLTITIA
jgi:Rieske Fe-S protein